MYTRAISGGAHNGNNQDFYQAVVAIKTSNLHMCFCSFDLSCSILEKIYIYQRFIYCIVLSH